MKATFDALDEDGSGQLELDEVRRGALAERQYAPERVYAGALATTFPDHRVAMLRSRGWPRRWRRGST